MPTNPSNDTLLKGGEIGILDHILVAALRNKALVLIALVFLMALGFQAARRLPIDAVPDVTNVQVQVLTDAPGLSPLEVERLVTYPVELAMSGLPHTEEMRSLSRFGLSVVTVVFEEGTDLYFARQLIGERLALARESIPHGLGEVTMGPMSSGLGEIVQFEVRGEGYALMDLRDILEWQIAPQLRTIDGIVEINPMGGALRTFQVEVDPRTLSAYGLSLGEVFEALERNNVTTGGGSLTRGREQMLIRGMALLTSLEDIRQVVVKTSPGGMPLTIGTLAKVEFAPLLRHGAVTRDGRGEAVVGTAMMLYGANARVVATELVTTLEELGPSLPPGVEIDVYYDRTKFIEGTLRIVGTNLLEGGGLVVLVLLMLLGSLRGGLIVALAIPLSMLVAVIGMVAAGLSGNLMSLGALDFGLIVDGSVVMVEHIIHRLGVARREGRALGDGVILGAAREVARPVSFSVGIIILVYLPILALTGIEGKMFRPMALTVVFALMGSLVVSLTVMPVLASLFLKEAEDKDTPAIRAARFLYRPALRWGMGHPGLMGGGALMLFLMSLSILPFMGAEFIPRLDEGSIAMQVVRPPSVSLEESITQGTLVEEAILEAFPDEVETVVCRTGRPEIATDPMGVDLSDVYIMLKPREEWRRVTNQGELVEALDALIDQTVPGIKVSFSQPIELRTNELIEGVRSDVALFIQGDELDTLKSLGAQVEAALKGVGGAVDVKAEQIAGLPMLRIEVDRGAAGRLGIPADDIMDVVATLGGKPVGTVFSGQRRFTLQVRFPEDVRQSPEAIGALLVGRPGGRQVPLNQVATLWVEEGPLQMSREDGQRRLTLEMNVRGRDVASFVAEAKGAISAAVVIPPGYRLQWGGAFENLETASARLALLVPLVLLLIFVLLQGNFRSGRHALLVFANVPMAVSGGLMALYVRGLPLSISAGVGFIALFGIAVMNGVVLLSHVKALHDGGLPAPDAAKEGSMDRLRPVLMTALVAALGFIPMALSTSAGAEVQRPLATVVIGGLCTSTLLTLLVLPALYGRWGGEASSP